MPYAARTTREVPDHRKNSCERQTVADLVSAAPENLQHGWRDRLRGWVYLLFFPGTTADTDIFALAASNFWLLSAMSCFLDLSFAFGDLSPMVIASCSLSGGMLPPFLGKSKTIAAGSISDPPVAASQLALISSGSTRSANAQFATEARPLALHGREKDRFAFAVATAVPGSLAGGLA